MASDTPEIWDEIIFQARQLMLAKNSDYGDSWKQMSTIGLTDQLMTRIARIKKIEKLQAMGETPQISEGIDQVCLDLINYSVFRYWAEYEYQKSPERRRLMGMAALENSILNELKGIAHNAKLKKKDILEWRTGKDLKAETDEEVAIYLPILQITAVILKTMDNR